MISLLARFFMLPKPQTSPVLPPEAAKKITREILASLPVVKKKRSVKKPAAKKPTPKSRAKKKP